MLRSFDLGAAIAFYCEVLGFIVESQQPGWASLRRDAVRLMLAAPNAHLDAERTAAVFSGSLYIRTDDVDLLWTQLKDRARVCYAPESFGYGMREFAIYDCDGYLVQFGQPLGS